MKSMTSCSLAPACSCSRIWFLISTASGAFDSASVWFWQTRQRSSRARPPTRLSSAGSACARATPAISASASRLALTRELPQQRLHFLERHFRRKRPDVLVADHPAPVDDVGLGYAVDAVVDADWPVAVEDREGERGAVALGPRTRVR